MNRQNFLLNLKTLQILQGIDFLILLPNGTKHPFLNQFCLVICLNDNLSMDFSAWSLDSKIEGFVELDLIDLPVLGK